MKTSLIITYSLVCLLAFCGGIFAGLFYNGRQEDTIISAESEYTPSPVLADSVSNPPTPSPPPLTNNISEQYMLTASDNGISVYKVMHDGSTELVLSREVDIAHLRQEDFSELCRGVVVNNYEDAIKLLEDFAG